MIYLEAHYDDYLHPLEAALLSVVTSVAAVHLVRSKMDISHIKIKINKDLSTEGLAVQDVPVCKCYFSN